MKHVTMKCAVAMSVALLLLVASAHALESNPERDADIGTTADETPSTTTSPAASRPPWR